jgi:hypothetical protein
MDKFASRGLEFTKKSKGGKEAKPKGEEAKGEKEPKGGEKSEPKGKKHRRPKEIHLRRAEGGFIAKHIHDQAGEIGPGQDTTEHLIPAEHEGDLDGLHQHLEDHWGGPNVGEKELSPETIHGKGGMPNV